MKARRVAGVKRLPRRPHKPKTAGSTPARDPIPSYNAQNVLDFPWHTPHGAPAQPTWDVIGSLATIRLVAELQSALAGFERERTWVHVKLTDALATMKECRALLGGLQRPKKPRDKKRKR